MNKQQENIKYYETLMLLRISTTDNYIALLEQSFRKLLDKHSGSLSKFDNWGRLRLAYPIDNKDYGVYILSRYSLPKENAKAFAKTLDSMIKIKFTSWVLRYLLINVTKEAFDSEYTKPESSVAGIPSMRSNSSEPLRFMANTPSADLKKTEAKSSQAQESEDLEVETEEVNDKE